MSEKKFRFKDLETEGGAARQTPKKYPGKIEDEVERAITRPRQTRSKEEVEAFRSRKKTNLEYMSEDTKMIADDIKTIINNMACSDDMITILHELQDIKSIIGNKTPCYHGDMYTAYSDMDNDDIQYYIIDGVVVEHNTFENVFGVGDNVYDNMSIDEIADMILNDDTCDVSVSESNIDHIRRFFDAYTHAISDMVRTLANLTESYEGNIDYLNDIKNTVAAEIHNINKSDDDDESAQYDDSTDDEVAEDDEMIEADEAFVDVEYDEDITDDESDYENQSHQDILDAYTQDVDDLPTIEEVEDVEPNNLRDYADAIDKKIPDNAADELIKNARLARRNRSIQHQYVAPKK